MPVSSRGPRRRRSWWCHTPLIDPGYPHACEAGGVQMRPCRHGLIGDHTVFHVVPHWRASPKIVAPSKRNCWIARVPRRTPVCAHLLAILQECHRLAGGFASYPAPYCATGSAPEPRPKARRSPLPPHARDREQVTPQPGQPAQRSQDSMSSTREHSLRATETRWKPSKSTSRSHRSQRPGDTEQQQVG